jgi:2-polyprenyl-6-methoxyphenol hydroxylase-like FAD-dependent oxidoreductase
MNRSRWSAQLHPRTARHPDRRPRRALAQHHDLLPRPARSALARPQSQRDSGANPTLRGFFRIEKPFESGFLVVKTTGDPAHPNEDLWSGLTNDRCIEYFRSALGDDSIPLQIDDVMKWNARADVAARFREGRIFLAGDAAHVMPPYGGYGGNVGVQDAHALAWKLAYVLREWAGEQLLSTYEPERRPAGALTTEQAYTRYVTREAK